MRRHSTYFAHPEQSGATATTPCGVGISILLMFHLAHSAHRLSNWYNCRAERPLTQIGTANALRCSTCGGVEDLRRAQSPLGPLGQTITGLAQTRKAGEQSRMHERRKARKRQLDGTSEDYAFDDQVLDEPPQPLLESALTTLRIRIPVCSFRAFVLSCFRDRIFSELKAVSASAVKSRLGAIIRLAWLSTRTLPPFPPPAS
jgi:hypothetical protein